MTRDVGDSRPPIHRWIRARNIFPVRARVSRRRDARASASVISSSGRAVERARAVVIASWRARCSRRRSIEPFAFARECVPRDASARASAVRERESRLAV